MYKKVQLVTLPTNEKANICLDYNKLVLNQTQLINCTQSYQHLYILSDEKPKERDWYISATKSIISQHNGTEKLPDGWKKIIATTDKSLKITEDLGEISRENILPQIPQSFIEYFVFEYNKGNIITEVMVEYELGNISESYFDGEKEKLPLHLKINPDNTINIKPIKDVLYHGKTLEYWKQNAEENYLTTPISVLKYISILEEAIKDSYLLRKDFDLEIIDSDVDNIFLNGLTEGYNKSHLEKSLIQRCKIVYLLMKYLNFEKNNNIKLFTIDKFKNMTQINRVPFNYEYFKQHPETKLETRNGDEVKFIGKASICVKEDSKLLFETEKYIITTTIDGFYIDNESEYQFDILMLIELKEEVVYGNVHEDYIAGIYDTLEDAIEGHGYGAKSVAKLTIVDGELIKTETVHKY